MSIPSSMGQTQWDPRYNDTGGGGRYMTAQYEETYQQGTSEGMQQEVDLATALSEFTHAQLSRMEQTIEHKFGELENLLDREMENLDNKVAYRFDEAGEELKAIQAWQKDIHEKQGDSLKKLDTLAKKEAAASSVKLPTVDFARRIEALETKLGAQGEEIHSLRKTLESVHSDVGDLKSTLSSIQFLLENPRRPSVSRPSPTTGAYDYPPSPPLTSFYPNRAGNGSVPPRSASTRPYPGGQEEERLNSQKAAPHGTYGERPARTSSFSRPAQYMGSSHSFWEALTYR
ncbi:hypothetical protein BT69DRAFT_1336380 [Atractiella rhizophila]|nr:hypothetical protein BT69DRAFT_1336380 [Atractiella rhizophila]